MSSPLLSVCIPHIREPYLAECVDSVTSQGLQSYEVICVEDEAREGSGATRNRCFASSKGEYIMCMDADDVLPLDTLQPMLALAAPKTIVCTQAVQFFNKEGLQHRWTWYESLLRPHNLLTMPVSPLGTGNVIYPRALHDEVGGFPTDCGGYESWAFFARAALADYRYVMAYGTEYLHRLHPDSYWCSRPDHRADLQAALMHVYADRMLG